MPFRVVLSTGDLGFLLLNLIWKCMPVLIATEISSCNVEFQARRANIRFRRDAKSKPGCPYPEWIELPWADCGGDPGKLLTGGWRVLVPSTKIYGRNQGHKIGVSNLSDMY